MYLSGSSAERPSLVSPRIAFRFSRNSDCSRPPAKYTPSGGAMRIFRQLHKSVFLLSFSLVTLLPLGAQVDQGRITGVVRDPSKAAIGSATVTITNDRTGEQRTANTNDQGYYSFLALQPSLYTVKVSAAQFAPAEAKQLRVTVGQEVHQDFDLAVQSQTESVVVEATAVQIDTSSARIGINVNPREVNQLP